MVYFRHLILSAAVSLVFVACSTDDLADVGGGHSSSIGFEVGSVANVTAQAPRGSVTRMVALSADADSLWLSMTGLPTQYMDNPHASRGTQLDQSSMTDFGVSCMRTIRGTGSVYFHAEKYVGSAVSDSWSGKTYYWMPADARFDFFAWAPYSAPVSVDVNSGTFNYTVPADVRSQPDLCGCSVDAATPGRKVPLKFEHLLSRIVFNVPHRDDLAIGTVTGIEISNLVRSGSYSLSSGEWSLDGSDLFTFKIRPEADYVSGTELTANGLRLFMLPQTIAEGAIVTITFKAADGAVKTFTRPLDGITWLKGYTYTFNVGIADDGAFEFVNDTPIQDANYVMHANVIHPVSVDDSQSWMARVWASDGADVSIQKEADVNDMALSGFWTDRVLDKNGRDKGSARGSDQISATGSADVPVRLFLPENVSDQNRIIYVDFYLDGASQPATTLTLLQYCPDWVGDYGWEQIDDNGIGNFGFDWTRSIFLTYKYNIPIIGYTNTSAYKYVVKIRESYGSPSWTSLGSFRRESGVMNRWYIWLDYGKLTNLTGSGSRTDGLGNTVWLNQYGGDAATMAMENGILSIRKTEVGHTHETAFRIATREDDGKNAPTSVLTSPKLASDIALSHALMKNPFDIMETEANDDGEMGYIPKIKEIKWYLPAVDQFATLPRLEPISPGEYWSSTVEPGTDTEPYDGSGVRHPRGTWLKIRACRNR